MSHTPPRKCKKPDPGRKRGVVEGGAEYRSEVGGRWGLVEDT